MTCPKCAIGTLSGPRYRHALTGAEYLVYTCSCCGYEDKRPTADSTPVPEWVKALTKQQEKPA